MNKEYLRTEYESETGKPHGNALFSTTEYACWLEKRIKSLEHHKDTTVGLWATDRPDLVDDPKGILFRINYTQLKTE